MDKSIRLIRPGDTSQSEFTALSIGNEHVAISLDEGTRGGLSAFVDRRTQRNFIAPGPHPLYRLTLAGKGGALVEVTSLDAESFEVERSSTPERETLTLTCGSHRDLDIRVTCRVSVESGSPLSRWRIDVANGTGYGVRAIRYPVVIAPSVLGESDEDDYFVWGFPWGTLIPQPGRSAANRFQVRGRRSASEREAERYINYCPIHYPGVIMVQFHAYYDNTGGLYLATYDDSGSVKQFGLGSADVSDAVDLTITHRYDEHPGLSFELPYDTVVAPFHGDWRDAADIYKEWASQQHWCARKLADRTDVPEWIKEPRPWLAVISRGTVERFEGTLSHMPSEHPIGKFWPARNAVPLIQEYSRIFDTPVVTWMEGWEKIGSPGGPVDIFPPYEGEESFKAAMAEFTRQGNHPFMYLAGFHWCYKRPAVGYDDWERFEREGRESATIDDKGELIISNLQTRTYLDGQKQFVAMCIGSERTREITLQNCLTLMELGAVAVQFDEVHGFYSDACYSETHDHPPGFGPWMYQKMLQAIREFRGAIREKHPLATLSCEDACELWIQELDIFMRRPYSMGGIPLFEYLYHEYVPGYGGDDHMGLCHPEVELLKQASVFIYGLQHFVGIGKPEYDFQVNPEYPILLLHRNMCRAQRTFGREYLVFGQMLRPAPLAAATREVYIYQLSATRYTGGRFTVTTPCVLHSTWRSPAGRIGTVLVNWTGEPQEVTLSLEHTPEWISIITGGETMTAPAEALRAGKVTLTVPAREVALVE